jgi:hypothetical protein
MTQTMLPSFRRPPPSGASGFSFKDMPVGTTPVSKVWTPLPLFPIELVSTEDISRVLVEVETEVERFLGSFGPRDCDAVMAVKLPNGGHLNRVFEQKGVAYAPRPLPGSEASQVVRDKRKAEVSKKPAVKKAKTSIGCAAPSKMVPAPSRGVPPPPKMAPSSSKAGPSKKMTVLKVVHPRVKTGPQGMSEIKLALAKPVGMPKKFCLLDVIAPSLEFVVRASPRLILVSALLECWISTILVMTRRLIFARPPRLNRLERDAHVLRH